MYDSDNNRITSLDDLCMCMSKPASLNSRITSLVLKTYKSSPIEAAKISDLWNCFSAESKGFAKYPTHIENGGIVMAAGFDPTGDICVTYDRERDRALHNAFRNIDRVFNGIVLLRAFNVFAPNYGFVNGAAVVYTGTPQAIAKDISKYPTRVLASVG